MKTNKKLENLAFVLLQNYPYTLNVDLKFKKVK